MECNAVCQGIGQFLGNAFLWVAGVSLVGFLIGGVVRSIEGSTSESRRRRVNDTRRQLETTIDQLRREIADLSPVSLTSEDIPQRFASKEEAQAFGKKWSRGGPDSFTARAYDADGWDDYHQEYDPSRVAGGFLYPTPALFYGLKTAYSDSEQWWIDFLRAKEAWLRSYRDYLRDRTTPVSAPVSTGRAQASR